MIFDDPTIQKLEHLSLVATRVRAGLVQGERRSPRKGSSIEFADYRNYSPGDDLRRLDWNIYARLNKPFVKLFEEEEDLAVYLLLDASKSMDWGEGDENKFRYALRLGGGLGLMALASGDRVSPSMLSGGGVISTFGPLRGLLNVTRLLSYFEAQKTAGSTDLNRALESFNLKSVRPGLSILISDLFSPSGCMDGLRALQKKGHEVILIQVLSPDELSPAQTGDLQLVDAETRLSEEVTITPGLKRLYHSRLEAWRQEIKTICITRGIHYFSLATSQPWDEFILSDLRRRGIVR